MRYALTAQTLHLENQNFAGTGGISPNNRSLGFQPGFYDAESGQIAISRFANGTPAPIHVLDELPADWFTARKTGNGVISVKASVISGFIHGGRFYTRTQVARLTARIRQVHSTSIS